jgi:hypothetical protein
MQEGVKVFSEIIEKDMSAFMLRLGFATEPWAVWPVPGTRGKFHDMATEPLP